MNFTDINGHVAHWRVDGARSGDTALVFSNSLGTDFRIWDEVVAELGDCVAMLRYDTRGHGLSETGPLPMHVQTLADDLLELAGLQGFQRIVICGLSVGGLIAMAAAARAPARVAGLVLSNTAPRIGNDEMWNTRIDAIRAGGLDAMGDSIMERWLSPEYRRTRPIETRAWRTMLVRTDVEGYIGLSTMLRDTDLTEAARAIDCPVETIAGSEDGSTPPDLIARMTALIPGAGRHLIEGAGHLPCLEAPERVAGICRSVLGRAGLFG